MATFGYAEMRDWAEQSDDPRVKSMWQRLSNCRSKIAKWCQAAEYAELRTKNLAADNAALRAEVERLHADVETLRESLLRICIKYDWAYSTVPAKQLADEFYDAKCIAANALHAVPAPPAKEE